MKINISRQNIYLLSLSIFLFIFVLIFAFGVLIPAGKEYRNEKAQVHKEKMELRKYEDYRDEILEQYTELKSENRNIIKAFDTEFNADRFQKMHTEYFNSLTISPKVEGDSEGVFSVYEVQTTSAIDSPQSFYDFLDAVNKSDWIISINFPINFKREEQFIRSSFTMKVYGIAPDTNASEEVLLK